MTKEKLEPELRFAEFAEEWKEKRLGDTVNYTKGFAFKSKNYKTSGTRIIRVSDTTYQGINDFAKDKKYISNKDKDKYNRYKLNKGQIIISTVGSKPPQYNSLVGRAVKVLQKHDGMLLNQNQLVLTNREKFNSNYLYNYLRTDIYLRYIERTIRGNANQANITVEDLLNFGIKIPSKKEQEKIGSFLETIDRKIELQEELIENLEEQKKGLMQKIFNQEVRFKDENGKDYREWEEDSIDGFIESNYLRLIQPKELKEFQGSRIYLSTSSIDKYGIVSNEGLITYNNRPSRASMIPLDNSVWFAKMKESIKVYLANKDSENRYVLSTGFYGLKPNCKKINSEYLKQVLLSDDFNNQKDLYSEGTSMSAIKDDHLRFINMNIPNIKEQNKISDLLSLWDNKIDLEKEQLENYKEYKKGLMQRMFI